MISIYDYTHYQTFLKAYYEQEKGTKSFFSYKYLADKCGFKSKTYLHKVICGEKALNVNSALKIGTFLQLKKREMDYFEAIVLFTNAKTVTEKEFYFTKLQKFSNQSNSSLLRQNQYDYFNHWYNSVIRELVTIMDWRGDYTQLAKAVVPEITIKEAKRSVTLLLELGLITCDEEGIYHRTNRSITTGADIVSLAVNHFQKENLRLAAEAIDRFPREKRDISTITMSIPEEGVGRIKDEIAQFRKRLIAIVEDYDTADRVYQVNFQSFPLTQTPKDTK